jgi:hypothetical protein
MLKIFIIRKEVINTADTSAARDETAKKQDKQEK